MSKLLLYCCKAKPYITISNDKQRVYPSCVISDGIKEWHLNGKIAAECDFEVEEINDRSAKFVCNRYYLEILKKSCLTDKQMYDYLKGQNGYAIHIKNLKIFDKPKELSEYGMDFPISPIVKAPQNMMYANGIGERYILISRV